MKILNPPKCNWLKQTCQLQFCMVLRYTSVDQRKSRKVNFSIENILGNACMEIVVVYKSSIFRPNKCQLQKNRCRNNEIRRKQCPPRVFFSCGLGVCKMTAQTVHGLSVENACLLHGYPIENPVFHWDSNIIGTIIRKKY